jgi:cytochrome o ubiquinol oxidase subunit I
MFWFLGFVVTFTIGGVAGVLMSVPAIDYQVHNSLFLVAHFHMMIVGGVVFGYFAGLTYWFPKIFGFRLNERLGKYAFWCWFVGFLLAFVPLYILGLMGATRRLDHYDASLGWQPLFIVAGIGALTIALGVGFQVLQLIVSIKQRKQNLDTTGDPWNGRTLEWATTSPAPFYNFAVVPEVTGRDAFWAMKTRSGKRKAAWEPTYTAFEMPKNTPLALFIAAFALLFGFAVIWHIWWLAPVGLLGAVTCVIIRTLDDDTEYTVSAAKLKRLEAAAREGRPA